MYMRFPNNQMSQRRDIYKCFLEFRGFLSFHNELYYIDILTLKRLDFNI